MRLGSRLNFWLGLSVSIFVWFAAFAAYGSRLAGQEQKAESSFLRQIAELPMLPERERGDWLVDPVERRAGVFRTERPGELVLDNGLVRRTFLLQQNLACVGLKNLQTEQEYLRAIRPECRVKLGDRLYDVGGMVGQPVEN
ncbi:MAG: hypothetical protein ACKO9H_02285, partial [Planctomycetota bacterium]